MYENFAVSMFFYGYDNRAAEAETRGRQQTGGGGDKDEEKADVRG